jgi:glycosyltransferase involved in cell wall biosynthesis
MMMRMPVLVPALGGPAETVVDGVTGWHVPAATAEAMTGGLRRAMRDRQRWKVMGDAARKLALENFSATAFVFNYLRLIAGRALDAPPRAGRSQ